MPLIEISAAIASLFVLWMICRLFGLGLADYLLFDFLFEALWAVFEGVFGAILGD